MALTRKKLENFVQVRNRSPHNSNLQFYLDASSCGIKELPTAIKVEEGTYLWKTEFGMLVEVYGKLFLSPPNSTADEEAIVNLAKVNNAKLLRYAD